MEEKTAMISQPMNGYSDDEIKATRNRAVKDLENLGYRVIDTYFDDVWAHPDQMRRRGVKHIPVAFLSKAIEKMAECDLVYFCKGWDSARGCKLEHAIAEAYGIDIIEEI